MRRGARPRADYVDRGRGHRAILLYPVCVAATALMRFEVREKC